MLNKALKVQSIVEKIGKFNYIKNNILSQEIFSKESKTTSQKLGKYICNIYTKKEFVFRSY